MFEYGFKMNKIDIKKTVLDRTYIGTKRKVRKAAGPNVGFCPRYYDWYSEVHEGECPDYEF